MATLLFLAPLLLLGTALGQAQTEIRGCQWLWNATEGNFSVQTTPETYWANTTYLVTIKDARNHSSSTGQYLLQALSPQNDSVGEWKGLPTGNCSSVTTAILNITENATLWTSPDRNFSSVQIRVYLTFPGNTSQLKTFTLNRAGEATTQPSSTPSSAPRPWSSSLSMGALLLLTGTLLS